MFYFDNSWLLSELNKYDANVWVVELQQSSYALSYYWNILSPDEKERALSFKTKDLQNRYTISRGTLRRLLSCYLNIPAIDLKFTYNPQDKPKIENSQNIFFNLSHSKNIGLIAISKRIEIGVDLEFVDDSVDIDSISKIIMTISELEIFNSLSKDKKIQSFYENWTKKEAFIKCLGLGLSFDLKNCFVGFEAGSTVKLKPTFFSTNKNWFIKDIELKNKSFKAAVALETKFEPSISLKNLTDLINQMT